nr:MAG TPA: hypothetical protein [Caudoviricetes sp.]DAI85384.1 MAG TPA: hypothetical protein [Caudoviricetes sp.]
MIINAVFHISFHIKNPLSSSFLLFYSLQPLLSIFDIIKHFKVLQ